MSHSASEEMEKMNKLERRYADNLELKRLAGEIQRWRYEPCKFELAHRCTYTPDFDIITKDGYIEYHEVKCPDMRLKSGKIKRGEYLHPETFIKLKVAARQYPQCKFVLVKWHEISGWTFKEIPK